MTSRYMFKNNKKRFGFWGVFKIDLHLNVALLHSVTCVCVRAHSFFHYLRRLKATNRIKTLPTSSYMNSMDVMNLRSDLICRGDEQEVVSVPTSASVSLFPKVL